MKQEDCVFSQLNLLVQIFVTKLTSGGFLVGSLGRTFLLYTQTKLYCLFFPWGLGNIKKCTSDDSIVVLMYCTSTTLTNYPLSVPKN